EIPAGDTADADAAPWDARPRSWVAPGMQAWFLQRDRQDPAGYAETWLQDSSLELDPPAYEAAYRGYLEDFDARGVAGVGFGHVWLRRPTADG
ncbi:methyltransferase, partial [Xanthomonas citri pv. citri]|nr:methyltransferase [Xanthomonas citri pv. citri]